MDPYSPHWSLIQLISKWLDSGSQWRPLKAAAKRSREAASSTHRFLLGMHRQICYRMEVNLESTERRGEQVRCQNSLIGCVPLSISSGVRSIVMEAYFWSVHLLQTLSRVGCHCRYEFCRKVGVSEPYAVRLSGVTSPCRYAALQIEWPL